MMFFVHVGKTGGTTLKRRIRAHFGVEKAQDPQVIEDRIVLLNHVSLADAVKKFGTPSGVAFAYRDPTARFISGFYCRQRMGLPDHRALWDPREAAAFAHFDTANALAEALATDNPARRAAAFYAMDAIRHLRRNYRYHFGHLTDFLLDFGDRVQGCIDTANIDTDASAFLHRIGVEPTKADATRTKTPDHPRTLSDLAQRNLQSFWAEEYEYYSAFKLLEAEIAKG